MSRQQVMQRWVTLTQKCWFLTPLQAAGLKTKKKYPLLPSNREMMLDLESDSILVMLLGHLHSAFSGHKTRSQLLAAPHRLRMMSWRCLTFHQHPQIMNMKFSPIIPDVVVVTAWTNPNSEGQIKPEGERKKKSPHLGFSCQTLA